MLCPSQNSIMAYCAGKFEVELMANLWSFCCLLMELSHSAFVCSSLSHVCKFLQEYAISTCIWGGQHLYSTYVSLRVKYWVKRAVVLRDINEDLSLQIARRCKTEAMLIIHMDKSILSSVKNSSYEKAKTFKSLGSSLKNQNSIQEKIKCRLLPLLFLL